MTKPVNYKNDNNVTYNYKKGVLVEVEFTGHLTDLQKFNATPLVISRKGKPDLIIKLIQDGGEYKFVIWQASKEGEKAKKHLRFYTNDAVVVENITFRHSFPRRIRQAS